MKVWGLAATLGFGILAFGFGQAVGGEALQVFKSLTAARVDLDGTAVAIFTLVANPVQTITLVLAGRMTGEPILPYFGLNLPRWRDVAIVVAGLVLVIVLADVLTLASGRDLVPASQLEVHRSARTDGTLAWLWLAIIVVAPIGEELLFRGFLFRGFVREPRDVLPGILVISLIWSLLHRQDDWFSSVLVFGVGVLFGYARHFTGSTTLVIALHALLNLESVIETLVVLGWL